MGGYHIVLTYAQIFISSVNFLSLYFPLNQAVRWGFPAREIVLFFSHPWGFCPAVAT